MADEFKDQFQFWGNINVGQDISVEQLQHHFNAIIFATGAQKDRQLNINGENLKGVLSAGDWVAWYNGVPTKKDLMENLSKTCNHLLDGNKKNVVVIGHGNVSLDVSRILLLSQPWTGKIILRDFIKYYLTKSFTSKK